MPSEIHLRDDADQANPSKIESETPQNIHVSKQQRTSGMFNLQVNI